MDAEHSSSSIRTIRGTIHGVGRWERLNPTDAELAFVIEDACQGQGLGRNLVEATIERAHEEGLTRLVTDVLPSNYRMRRVARDYGLVAKLWAPGRARHRTDRLRSGVSGGWRGASLVGKRPPPATRCRTRT